MFSRAPNQPKRKTARNRALHAILAAALTVGIGGTTAVTAIPATAVPTVAVNASTPEPTSTSGYTATGKFLGSGTNVHRLFPATALWTIKDPNGNAVTTSAFQMRATYYPDSTSTSNSTRVEFIDSIGYNKYLGHSYQTPLASFEKYVELVLVDNDGLPFGPTLVWTIQDFRPDVIDVAHSITGSTSTLTAKLKVAGVYGTGNIEFYSDGTPIGTAPTVGQDITAVGEQSVATLVTDHIGVGTHQITAKFLANGHLTDSQLSDPISITITPDYTVKIPAISTTYGDTADITFEVEDQFGAPAPDSTLDVQVDGTNYALQTSNGSAQLSYIPELAGTYGIGARYGSASSDGSFASATGTLTVSAAPTTVSAPATLTFQPEDSTLPLEVLVSAVPKTSSSLSSFQRSGNTPALTVLPTIAAPTGTVSISIDGTTLTTEAIDSNGTAKFVISKPSTATGTLTVDYSGDGNYEADSTDIAVVVVSPEPEPTVTPTTPEPTEPATPSPSPTVTTDPQPVTPEPSSSTPATPVTGNGEQPSTDTATDDNDNLANTGSNVVSALALAFATALAGGLLMRSRGLVGKK